MNIANTLLETIQAAIFTRKISKQTSLSEVSRSARVQPLVIISKDCITLEVMDDLLQSLLNVFIAYYLQAVSLMTTVNSVKVIKILDQFSPDRNLDGYFLGTESLEKPSTANADETLLMLDSYQYTLPTKGNERAYNAARLCGIAQEDKGPNKSPINVVTEQTNLVVGKLVNVTISSVETNQINNANAATDQPNKSVTIPVLFQFAPASLLANSILHILAFKTEDTSLLERYHLWRAGRISFIRDLIFCQDLIDEHKKELMHDTDGIYSQIIGRGNSGKIIGLLSQKPSLASASNIFIISEEVAKALELRLGGKLSVAAIRQKAFENTYGMILVIIDRNYERVTIYTRGNSAATELGYRQLSTLNRQKGGPDIMDILKTFSLGSSLL